MDLVKRPMEASGPSGYNPKILYSCRSIFEALGPFSCDLLRYHASTKPNQNVFFSPWSIFQLLSLIRLGGNDRSIREIGTLLKTNFDPVTVAKDIELVMTELDYLISSDTLALSTSLWVNDNIQVLDLYQKVAAHYMHSEIRQTRFPEPGNSEVAKYINEKTKGRLGPQEFRSNQDTGIICIQTILMLDKWAKPFDAAETRELPFTNSKGEQSRVPMMSKSGTFEYGETKLFQTLNLQYGSGISMHIFLPRQGVSIPEVLDRLIWNLETDTKRYQGEVFLPRWEFELGWDVTQWMIDKGCQSLLKPESDAFPNMANVPLYIQAAEQKAKVTVNEQGTEAVAFTGVVIAQGCDSPRVQEPFEFRADRPFIFSILAPGGLTLFAGIVNDPSGLEER